HPGRSRERGLAPRGGRPPPHVLPRRAPRRPRAPPRRARGGRPRRAARRARAGARASDVRAGRLPGRTLKPPRRVRADHARRRADPQDAAHPAGGGAGRAAHRDAPRQRGARPRDVRAGRGPAPPQPHGERAWRHPGRPRRRGHGLRGHQHAGARRDVHDAGDQGELPAPRLRGAAALPRQGGEPRQDHRVRDRGRGERRGEAHRQGREHEPRAEAPRRGRRVPPPAQGIGGARQRSIPRDHLPPPRPQGGRPMRTPVAPLAALLVLLLAGAPLAPLVQGAYLVPAPDLVVDSMTTPDAVAGASVTFSAVVRNAGNAPAGPFDVQFQVDAAIVGTGHVNAAAPGNAYAVSCPTGWVALAGNHTLAVVVDPGYAVSESNETNNSGNQTFHVRAPDLVVLDFSTTPANPIVGDGITFHANVTNRGDAGTGVNVAVSFYVRVNGTGYEQLYPAPDGAPLAPGATATFTSGTFVGVEGNHTVRVETDHYNRVRESDETNNNLTAGFVVTQPRPGMMPDLLASLVAPNKSPLRAGDSVTFSANLRNVGNASAGAFTVRFEIDGAPFDDVRSGGLRQGFPYSPTTRAWSATPGNHVIRATADVFDEVAEL